MSPIVVDPISFPLKEELTPLGIDVTRDVLAECDVMMAQLVAEGRAEGLQLACREGCAACCTFIVGAIIQESAVVASAVQQLPQAVRAGVLQRLVAFEREWTRRYGKAQLLERAESALLWQAERWACPMLDPKDHSCLVYDDRPVACRVHHATYRLPGNVMTNPCACVSGDPPEGCFTSIENATHSHLPDVWMLNPSIVSIATDMLQVAMLGRAGTGYPEPGILPLQVLRVGRELYGWKNPPKIVKLPVLRSSFPRGHHEV